jgi:two-component sensor histidine kinase
MLMLFTQRSARLSYGIALASVAIATVVTLFADRVLHDRSAFLLFIAAVAASAGFGGTGPGTAATLLSALVIDWILIRPVHSLAIGSRGQALDLAVFIFLGLLASVVSGVMRRLHQREEDARLELEVVRSNLAFSARASVVLDSSLEYETTLNNVARLVVPHFADWCAIDLAGENGSIQLVAAAHKEPKREELVRCLQSRYPLTAQGQNPVQNVIATGQPVVYLDIPDSALVAAARDSEHLEALRALYFRSYMCVPLRARGRTLGSILFVSSIRDRYTAAEKTIAEDLARRAALAVDNALLYREAQDEIERRTQAEADIQDLNERLRRAMVETHHRVKNNLQVIAAMVDMRLMDGGPTVPSDEIRRLGTYIHTMAAVHDILTQESKEKEAADTVSAKAVLDKLLPLMQQTAGERSLLYETDDTGVTPKQGTSLALLVNELVSNALKHGKGEILVRFSVRGPKAFLEVCDDGPGFPPGFDPAKAANTGLDLILSMSRWDLSGEAVFTNRPEGGGRVLITFPLPE